MALLPALRFAKLKFQDIRHGRGITTAIGGGVGFSAPSDLRVEAVSDGVVIVRWTANASGVTQVYRSTDNITYAFVATVQESMDWYADQDLAEKTQYYYKLTADFGATFSSAASVVTYVVTRRHGIANTTTFNPYDPEGLAEQLRREHTMRTHASGSGTSCDLCIEDGALVVDCSTGCEWFKVIVDQNINSISIIGCPQCPEIDFIIPPNVTRTICGWPQGCGYHGDECFESPITTGPLGKTCKTDGSCFEGYAQPNAGGPSGKATAACPCRSALDITPAAPFGCLTDCLRIQCCGDNCTLDCGTSVTLKACGGQSPYTWVVSGNGELNITKGAVVKVSPDQVAIAGTSPTGAAFIGVKYNGDVERTGSAGNYTFVATLAPKVTMDRYNCDGAFVASDSGTSSIPPVDAACGVLTGGGCSSTDSLCTTGGTVALSGSTCSTTPGITFTYDYNPGGTVWSGAATYGPCTFSVPWSMAANGVQTTPLHCSGKVDIRTQAEVDAGCGCVMSTTTATVTDAGGVSVTVLLHE